MIDPERLQITQTGLGFSQGDTGLLKIEYDYGTTDNNSSLRQQKITVQGQSTPIVQDYVYNQLNRLKSATETANAQTSWKQTFEYDRYGNRRFDFANTTTIPQNNGVHNPQIDQNTNQFLVAEGYNYDAEGNLTGNPENQVFSYDSENRIKQSQNPATQATADYFYDGNGKRVRKVVGQEETIFVYDAFGKMVAEYTMNIPVTNEGTKYLTADMLGSPRAITDISGQVASRHDYMPFGEEVMQGTGGRTGAQGYLATNDGIRQQFTGYEKDKESGLDYAQARYYVGKHGRFTSVDPLTASANMKNPQTFNRYSYAMNSPYKFTDPLGLKPGCSGPCISESDYDGTQDKENQQSDSIRAEGAHLARIGDARDAAAANEAIAKGDQATAEAICARNSNLECKRSSQTQPGKTGYPEPPGAVALMERFSSIFKRLMDSSGHRTDKPLENGGWIYQRKDGSLFFLQVQDQSRRSSGGIYLKNPPEWEKGARVIAWVHTHPYTDAVQHMTNLMVSRNEGVDNGPSTPDRKTAENIGKPIIAIYEVYREKPPPKGYTFWFSYEAVGPDKIKN